MAQIVLPNSINYDEQLPSLMSGVNNYTQVLQPTNGSSFSQNGQIFFDFPSRGFIDPKSIYIRYRTQITAGAAGAVCECALYTPFARVDTFFNSQLFDTVNDYNIVANQWMNLYLGPNEKSSMQSAFGYSTLDGAITKYDSKSLVLGANTYNVAGPLICTMLTNCDKFIPAFATGGIRIVFTLDSYTNMCTNSTAPSAFTLDKFELVYDLVDFGSEVEQSVLNRDKIIIKSNSFNNQSVTVNATTNGTNTFVFNQRFNSIRNAILSSTCALSSNYVNGKFDSVDITCGTDYTTKGGSYSLNIGGVVYPQGGPLSTLNNRNGILAELRKATGNLYDWSKAMSIDPNEFNYNESGSTTTADEPGKFFVGFDLNKINSSSNLMLNGTSSANAPINAVIQFGAQTVNSHNLNLTLNYDAIITIDPRMKQLSVLQ